MRDPIVGNETSIPNYLGLIETGDSIELEPLPDRIIGNVRGGNLIVKTETIKSELINILSDEVNKSNIVTSQPA